MLLTVAFGCKCVGGRRINDFHCSNKLLNLTNFQKLDHVFVPWMHEHIKYSRISFRYCSKAFLPNEIYCRTDY